MNISNLSDQINEFKIVGLGEATHGQLKLNEFRNKLIKKLIIKYNFRVIAIEEQYSCCKIINNYIKNKNFDYKDGLDAFPFLSKIFVDLLKWLKIYNKKNNNKISIIGFDCQMPCPKYKSTSKTTQYINALIKKYKAIPYSEPKKRINFRDESMYKIFMKQYNPKYKYIVLGHIRHLQKEDYASENGIKWFGNYLYKKFKDNYLAIGNTFYSGSYLGKDINNNWKVGSVKVNVKKQFNSGIYDLSKAEYKDKLIYESGVEISTKDPYITFQSSKLNNRFDILVVINDEKPFTMYYD